MRRDSGIEERFAAYSRRAASGGKKGVPIRARLDGSAGFRSR